MKRVPHVLLLATVLLTLHVPSSVCRPRDRGMFTGHDYKNPMDEVLLSARDNAMSYLIGEKLLRYLQRNPRLQRSLVLQQFPFEDTVTAIGSRDIDQLARSLQQPLAVNRAPEEEGNTLDELVGLNKRNDDPPISIDLTFHLLRNMIEMARIESQKEQAELNRIYLDEVGK
uniref:Urocortin n=1 Tax=Plecoglossus altivelis TaxID=61084 RepID=A0A7G8ZB05_PLEAT|nr:urocortin [Plecoglossus altivelis]